MNHQTELYRYFLSLFLLCLVLGEVFEGRSYFRKRNVPQTKFYIDR